jgi:hypothetical protein
MEGSDRPPRLSLMRVVGEVGRIYVARWPLLIGAGLIIFVPLGLIEVGDELVQEQLAELEAEGLEAASIATAIGIAAVHAVGSLLGEVLYAGVVTAAVLTVRERRSASLPAIARTLPYWRLIRADLLLTLVVVLGMLALVVPGLVFLVWFTLIAPVIKIEGLGVIAAFRRSRDLVRGNAWRVFALIFPVLLAQDALSNGVHSGLVASFGEGFLGTWVAAIGANLVTAPFYALAVVVIYFELVRPSSSAQTA